MTLQVSPDIMLCTRQMKDIKEAFQVVEDNRQYLRVWLPWVDTTTTLADAKAVIKNWQIAFKKGTDMVFGIYFKEKYIGNIGVHDIHQTNRKATIGYWLAEEYQGRGIITSCVKALINYCFDKLALDHILIYCATENKKSRAVAQRLGFTLQDVNLKGENLYGQLYDQAVYCMKKEDWPKPNLYRKTAHLYDYDRRDNLTADIPFYLSYAKGQKGDILEMACGTGRVALSLAKEGYTVTGLDLSYDMLAIFKQKLNQQQILKDRIDVVQGNMANFALPKKYGMIIVPFRAFQALTEEADIHSCLSCVHAHLVDSGIFIVNVFRPRGTLDQSWCYKETVQWEYTDELTGNKIVKKHRGERIDTDRQIIYPKFAYEVTQKDGTIERLTEDLALKYYTYEQLKGLLMANHFTVTEEYGWYDKSDIATGRELIFVCQKA